MKTMINSPYTVQEKELERISLSKGIDGDGTVNQEELQKKEGEIK